MEKHFDAAEVEARWRRRWDELSVGHADASSARPAFVIALPPPNVTGALHMGHACCFSIQDALSRRRRMQGFEVEWCPGTDHAAIATQNVIERQLADEGITKEQLGREAFSQRVDRWYAEYGGRIYEQMRAMGFSCDWERSRFTLDDAYVRAIRTVFKALYDDGLIYRGPRIVNWCPRCRSAISDEEIEWREHHDTLYHVRYSVEGGASITVATVRPETMLGDTGVAVAPGDARYAALVGKHAVVPLVARTVPIFADPAVRPEFGTGALKVTPGHDPTDYDIGARHALPVITVIAADGTMDIPALAQYHGMAVERAREAVVHDLRRLGALVQEEPYVHEVGHCDRCGTVLEPLVSEQWWVRMATLAGPGIAAVESGELRFHPRRYADVYLAWMHNIRDWCISRQLWLGHAIPVATCANGHRFAWVDEPESCAECGDTTLARDPDVLDTWFSSGLWPFAIFGWPEETHDLGRFYPTDALVTAREIIFLWVARMIMTGVRFTARIPFTDVIINSTIQATDGSRMAKSKGNVVDPLDVIASHGADALRAWAAAVGTSGQDVRYDEDRIESYQRFANKLWQVTTGFVAGSMARLAGGLDVPEPDDAALEPEDRWMLAELAELIARCDAGLDAYRFHDVMERLYDTAWGVFCDRYVEMAKLRLSDSVPAASRASAVWTATTALDVILRLLHPFMPFVSEECAQRLPGAAPTLQRRDWPVAGSRWSDARALEAHAGVAQVIELVERVRAAAQEAGVRRGMRDRVRVVVHGDVGGVASAHVERLVAGLTPATVVAAHEPGASSAVVVVAGSLHADLMIADAGSSDGASERRLRELQATVERLHAQLGNAAFVERAPAAVVEEARRRLAEAEAQAVLLARGSRGAAGAAGAG